MKINIEKLILKTSFSISISRISGFIREIIFSAFIGTSSIMDAFIIAYTVPNFFRRILGEKAAESVFQPMYIRQKEKGFEYENEFVSKIFTLLGIILFFLVVIFYPISPLFIKLLAPGFDAETFRYALTITMIILPYMFFIGVYSFLGALLEANKKFSLYNISPFVYNSFLIFTIVLFYRHFFIYALAYGVLVGVIFQTLILYFELKKLNLKFKFNFDFNDDAVRKTGRMLIPITAGSGIEKISIYVDRIMASLLPIGSISALYFAFRLIDLPFAVFSIAISKVIHPYISSHYVYSDKKLFFSYIKKGILLNFIVLVPCSILFIIFAKPIIKLVYMRGSFDLNSLNMTYVPFIYYTIGIFPMGLVVLFSKAFYALLDTKSPLKIAFLSSIINILFNIILMPVMGIGGLALGTSISLWFNAVYLYILLKRKH